MLSDNLAFFPMNVVDVIAAHLQLIDPDIRVNKRMVDPADEHYTICVVPTQWSPDASSNEIRGGPNEESIQNYGISVVSILADSNEERGIRTHSNLASRIRAVLYRSQQLRIELQQLKVDIDGHTERALGWRIESQQYLSSESSGEFRFVSGLDITFRTHI